MVTATKSGMALARGGWRTPARSLVQGQESRSLQYPALRSRGGAGSSGKFALHPGLEMADLDLDIAAGHDEPEQRSGLSIRLYSLVPRENLLCTQARQNNTQGEDGDER
ncbi:unnamed protein product [Urochloa humidicola]